MRDEYGNEAPYDFKNVQFKRSGETYFRYTFSSGDAAGQEDKDQSVEATTNEVYKNVINPYIYSGTYTLNKIILEGTGLYNNTFEDDCHDIFIQRDSENNKFSNMCSNITVGKSWSGNTFGSDCRDINLGDWATSNTFGNMCKNIIYVYGSSGPTRMEANTFGAGSSNIMIGKTSSGNDPITFSYNTIMSTSSLDPIYVNKSTEGYDTGSKSISNKLIFNGKVVTL